MDTSTTSAGFKLDHVMWGAAPVHIPDERGVSYKTELVLHRSADRTEKINWWHAPDPRGNPHNHPWSFKSTILSGGLTMTVWAYVEGFWTKWPVTYQAGDTYEFKAEWFHTVDSVQPGTVTHMVCGPLVNGGEWGHLVDGDGLVFVPAGKDPSFIERLRAINPHLRPKGP